PVRAAGCGLFRFGRAGGAGPRAAAASLAGDPRAGDVARIFILAVPPDEFFPEPSGPGVWGTGGGEPGAAGRHGVAGAPLGILRRLVLAGAVPVRRLRAPDQCELPAVAELQQLSLR